jgi:hypothetical protein
MILMRIFAQKVRKVTAGWKKLHKDEFNGFVRLKSFPEFPGIIYRKW